MDALADPDPDNPIATEIARLMMGYMENFQRHAAQSGEFPASILRAKGSCPIEEITMRLVSEEISAAATAAKK